jgi:chemotaxis family two-component system sensor kinase Cph1
MKEDKNLEGLLSRCDQEPIHIPGSIQPHGILLGINSADYQICVVSENISIWLNLSPKKIIGSSLDTIFETCVKDDIDALKSTLSEKPDTLLPLKIHFKPSVLKILSNDKSAIADSNSINIGFVHQVGSLFLLEIEQVAQPSLKEKLDPHIELRSSISQMYQSNSILEACDIAANEIRRITGYDRVMIYRFDEDWNGQVIAEARESTQDSLLHLHYPASDIPTQARTLYIKNKLRIIRNRDYIPSKLHYHQNFNDPVAFQSNQYLSTRELDLSLASLRSASPIHLQYLKNMGVTATLTMSLVDGDSLWGLIACHHSSPKHISYEQRIFCESISLLFSWLLNAKARQTDEEQRLYSRAILNTLKDSVTKVCISANTDSLFSALNNFDSVNKKEPDILRFVDASGAIISLHDKLYFYGKCPSFNDSKKLIGWLTTLNLNKPFVTHCLKNYYSEAQSITHCASGLMVLPLLQNARDFIVWLRPELIETVKWAGKNSTTTNTNNLKELELSPRRSFATWIEQKLGESAHWLYWQTDHAERLVLLLTKIIIDNMARLEDLRAVNKAKDEFIAVISHELRTPIHAILGWIELIRDKKFDSLDLPFILECLKQSVLSQAKIIDDLLDIGRVSRGSMHIEPLRTSLTEVVNRAINSFQSIITDRQIKIIVSSNNNLPSVFVDPERIQQVFANILNNAIKFSPQGGQINISLQGNNKSILCLIRDEGCGIESNLLEFISSGSKLENLAFNESIPNAKQSGIEKNNLGKKGLGLGLSISKHIIELHNGQISIANNTESKGTTVNIEIPINHQINNFLPSDYQKEFDSNNIQVSQKICDVNNNKKHILLLERDSEYVQFFSNHLNDKTIEITHTNRGDTGLELALSRFYDLIISDITLPYMNGVEFITRLNTHYHLRGLKIPSSIAVSSSYRKEDISQALAAGFTVHLTKPITVSALMEAVTTLLFA